MTIAFLTDEDAQAITRQITAIHDSVLKVERKMATMEDVFAKMVKEHNRFMKKQIRKGKKKK